MRHDLQLGAYPIGFIYSVINRYKKSDCLKKEVQPLSFIPINYTRGVSEKFKSIVNRHNKRTVFKTKHTLRNSHTRTRPKRSPQETVNCVYSIPCQCGKSYTGETGRPWAVRLQEHRQNVEEGHLERSRLAQHSFEKNHCIVWKEAKILEVEINSVYRKYKEAAYLSCLQNPINKPSTENLPIWYILISGELSPYV
jgi:predicted GIY-YIG superfamily endonuclease